MTPGNPAVGKTNHPNDHGLLVFERLGDAWAYELDTGVLRPAEPDETREERSRPRNRGPARGRQRQRETSPDGAWVAVCRDWNVVLEPAEAETGEGALAAASGPGEAPTSNWFEQNSAVHSWILDRPLSAC